MKTKFTICPVVSRLTLTLTILCLLSFSARAQTILNSRANDVSSISAPHPALPIPITRADFNSDGKSDIVWQHAAGNRAIWLMNGTTFGSSVSLGVVDNSWEIKGTADFNDDGKPDILWQNNSNGARAIWLMNGTTFVSAVSLGVVPTEWEIVGGGDLNEDGKPDIIWQNTSNGERAIWIMNGTSYSSFVSLGVVDPVWEIVGLGNFSAALTPSGLDILWQNSSTGERGIWLMNGTVFESGVSLGIVATDWDIGGTGDYNNDGSADILWQNTATGERAIWLMSGTRYNSSASLGTVSPNWEIENY